MTEMGGVTKKKYYSSIPRIQNPGLPYSIPTGFFDVIPAKAETSLMRKHHPVF